MSVLPRIIINGGVLSPSELKNIVLNAESLGLNAICFGSRQDILFPEKIERDILESLKGIKVIPENEEGTQNIVSSYVSSGIFPNTHWLTGDTYLYILEQFRHEPRLKINITDPKQRLVPLFTGNLNFVASETEDYWFLYIQLPGWEKPELYPVLIYSRELGNVAREIENILQEEPENTRTIFDLINDSLDTNNRNTDTPLSVPFHPFPYYEGMNRAGSDTYWLGLYWRNNRYDTRFLKEMCDLCTESKIGKISITPWKSFIIKGIPSCDKLRWEKFLGRKGINVRHSMLELNWHLPVSDPKALELKNFLVNTFDKNDISTYGLTFAIVEDTPLSTYFTSIVIKNNKILKLDDEISLRPTYTLYYAKNFDPNTKEYITHVQEVDKEELPSLLMELSKIYFEQLNNENTLSEKNPDKETVGSIETEVYQCSECLTIYDEQFGDLSQGIPPETTFENLPENYMCSLCEAPKASFKKEFIVKQHKN